MNKEITMFELYELLKNDNQPKKVEWDNIIYTYDEVDCQYFDNEYNILTIDISNEYTMGEILYSKTIKILDDEENDEFEDIEFEDYGLCWCTDTKEDVDKALRDFSRGIIYNKELIAKLIGNQKKIISEIERLKNNK